VPSALLATAAEAVREFRDARLDEEDFDDLRDVSPQDARMQWRFAREPLRSPELGVSRFTYDPGARMPWGHRHRVQEEAYAPLVRGRPGGT
jgi:quercetin dioxygenase-like cupin family protein